MRSRIIHFILLLLLPELGFSQGIRAERLSERGAALADEGVMWQNPAALSENENTEFACLQRNHYLIGDWNDVAISMNRFRKHGLGWSVGYRQMGFSGWKDRELAVGTGTRITKRMSIGCTIGISQSSIQADKVYKKKKITSSLGTRIELTDHWTLGIIADDLQGVFKSENEIDRETFSLTAGSCVKLSTSFLLATEVSADRYSISSVIAFEYEPVNRLACSLGFGAMDKEIRGGIGYRINLWKIEACIRSHPSLGFSTGIGICYTRGELK